VKSLIIAHKSIINNHNTFSENFKRNLGKSKKTPSIECLYHEIMTHPIINFGLYYKALLNTQIGSYHCLLDRNHKHLFLGALIIVYSEFFVLPFVVN